jgi:hypothetical protein
MTDLEAMLAMLARGRIVFKHETVVERGAGHTLLVVEGGYRGFFSEMYFDPAGAFVGSRLKSDLHLRWRSP